MAYTLPCNYCYETGFRQEYGYNDNGICYKCDGSGRKKVTKKLHDEYKNKELTLKETVNTIVNEQQRKNVYEAMKNKARIPLYKEDMTPFSHGFVEHLHTDIKGSLEYGFFVSLNDYFNHIIKILFNEENEVAGIQVIDKIQLKKLPNFMV